jgi:hypothetical protein
VIPGVAVAADSGASGAFVGSITPSSPMEFETKPTSSDPPVMARFRVEMPSPTSVWPDVAASQDESPIWAVTGAVVVMPRVHFPRSPTVPRVMSLIALRSVWYFAVVPVTKREVSIFLLTLFFAALIALPGSRALSSRPPDRKLPVQASPFVDGLPTHLVSDRRPRTCFQ